MKTSLLTALIRKYYPRTAENIQELIESNVLLEKLAMSAYSKMEFSVQKYADIAERLNVLIRMVRAAQNEDYKGISPASLFISIAILTYFVSPIDLIPDFIPFVGGLDDVLLLGYLLKTIDKEIERFLVWENANNVIKPDAL